MGIFYRSWLFILALSLSFALGSLQAESQSKKVRIQLDYGKLGIMPYQLPSTLDIAGVDIRNQKLDIIGSLTYFNTLKEQGYPVELLEMPRARLDNRFMNPEKISKIIEELAQNYPDIVHVEKIGESVQKLPLYAVRFSTADNLSAKPSIVFDGMHHAREVMTTEITTDIMTYLAQNFENANTPWVNAWLSNAQIWVIPQVNPDGNNIVWTKDNMWRKNAASKDGSIYGVDLNRNYPYQWGACKGSSGSKNSDTYRGPAAGSEPESQALMNFIAKQNALINVSYHSYSELVIAPYGCQNAYTPEDAIVQTIGKEFAEKLVRDDDYAALRKTRGMITSQMGTYTYGQPWELLYPVDGDSISQIYHAVNTMAFVVEVNSSSRGFQPDYDKWRNPTVAANRIGWSNLINRALLGTQVRGRMLDAKTGAPVEGSVKIAGVKYNDESPRRSKNGVYQKLLIPGSYELIFEASGYAPQQLAISVDASAVQQDVYFEPQSDLF